MKEKEEKVTIKGCIIAIIVPCVVLYLFFLTGIFGESNKPEGYWTEEIYVPSLVEWNELQERVHYLENHIEFNR